MGRILAVCASPARGTEKRRVGAGRFTPEWGLVGDAHGGDWHRQVSLLSAEKIKAFNARGAGVEYGAFGENLVVEGVDLRALPVGTRMRCRPGPAGAHTDWKGMPQPLRHSPADGGVHHAQGRGICPRGGRRRPRRGRCADGGAALRRPALSGGGDHPFGPRRGGETGGPFRPGHSRPPEASGYEIIERLLLPDGLEPLRGQLIRLCDQRQPDLILTTGGTGFSPRM
ncbi:MAG: MOSC domain-containing protein [Intestinimonas sp.]